MNRQNGLWTRERWGGARRCMGGGVGGSPMAPGSQKSRDACRLVWLTLCHMALWARRGAERCSVGSCITAAEGRVLA